MIKLTAEMNIAGVIPIDYVYLREIGSKNNISKDIEYVLNTKKTARNPFIIGSSKIGDGSHLSSGEEYFISKRLSDEDGNFKKEEESFFPPSIELYNDFEFGEDRTFSGYTLQFDTTNNTFPTYFDIGLNSYDNDDPIFTIAGLSPSRDFNNYFHYLNKPYVPLIITGIYTEQALTFNSNALLNLNIKSLYKSNLETPNYGIISNNGNITIIDIDGETKEYAEYGFLTRAVEMSIFINDTISNRQSIIGKFKICGSKYNSELRQFELNLNDNLTELQEIQDNGIDLIISGTHTAKDFYLALYDKTPLSFGFKKYSDLDTSTKNRLENTSVKYYFMESGTLWQQWNKLAELVQANIFSDENGTIKFTVEE